MLVAFLGYLVYLRRCFRGCAYVEEKEKRKVDRRVLIKGLVFIIISIGALALGAELTVSSAVDLATRTGRQHPGDRHHHRVRGHGAARR